MSESMAYEVEVSLNGVNWTCCGMVEFDVQKGEPMRMPNARDDVGYPGDPDEISDITVTEVSSITCEDKDGNEYTFSYEGEHVLGIRPDESEIKQQIEGYFDANLEELNY